MIPKIIHYCWYGQGEMSPVMKMCLASWREMCPQYVIKEWNEDNTPMTIKWIKDAYKHRKYAFVADYMRFYALYNEGGIYMDTDILLTRSLDDFLDCNFFIGRQDKYSANFAIFGCEPFCDFCKNAIDKYNSLSFNVVKPPIITQLFYPELANSGFVEEDISQTLSNNIVIFKSSYFYPIHYTQHFDISSIMSYAQSDTYAIHLWNMSWKNEFTLFEEGSWEEGFKEVAKRLKHTPFLPLAYWKKLIKYTGRYLGLWKR